MKKRILSILLMCCMVLTLLPVTALAEDSAYTVGEDTSVSARALAGTAGTKLKADNIDAYVANGLGGGVYTLAEDVTISGTLRVTGEATVDLNGYVLRYAEEAEPGSIFRVAGGKTLTMTDSRPEAKHEDENLPAGGLITGGEGYRRDYGAGQSYSYYGGGVYVEAGASFVLAGGTIYACGVQSGAFQAFGGGIYAEGGSVTMTGGAIRNCVVSANNGANGGGVYIYSGASFTMEGGVIAGCSAMGGGGIFTSGSTVRITGGRIENCKASGRGGGLSVRGHADQISVLDAAISGCEAKNGGGVALIGFAELELGENARITGCKATNGAAVYTDLDNPLTVNYPGCFLYANGGRVEGSVYVGTNKIGTKNNYLDSVKATNAIDHTDGKPTTVFTDNVSCEGDIRGGSFHGSVTVTDSNGDMGTAWEKFCGNLSGGTFYGPVTTECHVSGGTYYGGLTMGETAKLSGKPMNTGSELTDKTNIPNPNGKPAYVVIAGDRGLAGGYNNNIFKLVHAEAAGREMIVVPVGKKALEYYRHKNIPVWSGAYQEAGAVTVGDCFTMANMLCRDFRRGEFDEIRIAFTTFVSALSQTPTTMGLLPIVVDHSGHGGGRSGTRITYEPDSETVYDMIVPEYLGGLIYGALCESFASEQGARRMAMDSATKNAGAMIDDLTLRYNRARQGAITQEITEIVAGAQYE